MMTGSRHVYAALTASVLLFGSPVQAQTQDDLFDDTRLQDIQLIVSERDWSELRAHADEDTYYPADLRWNGITVRNVGIRSRGTGSRNGIKPGLRVDVNRYLSDQAFLGLKALVLDNLYTDPSTMRERLSMKLFARMGFVASREVHARLFVNGQYVGLYVVVEPIDRTMVERAFGSDEANIEDGGYLYEYQWRYEYGFEYLGAALAPYAELFQPETRQTDAAVRSYQPLEELIRRINEAPIDRFEAEVGASLDLREAIRFLALQNVVAEIDGLVGNWGLNNFHLYRFRDGRPPVFLPWDADHAFWTVDMPIDYRLDTNVLTRRAMQLPRLRELYLDTLIEASTVVAAQAVPGDPRGWLEREADRIETLVADAVAADPLSPFSFEEFRGSVQSLRSLLRDRPPYVIGAATAAAGSIATLSGSRRTAR